MPPFWQTPASRRHAEVLAILKKLTDQGAKLMASAADIKAKLDEIDVTTTEIAGDLDEVIAKLENSGGLSAAEAQEIADRLSGHSETLKGVAAKVPEPVVEPPV